jgi:2-phospho-L-lactate/phosphoenolpyruvate guanylyltransferase
VHPRPEPPTSWQLVLPVKGGAGAKSRLRGALERRTAHERLAAALAMDCLAAVLACSQVGVASVVTADAGTAAQVRALGARTVPESRPGAGLLAAVDDGLRACAPSAPVAVLLADLPCLRPGDLAGALEAAEGALAGGAACAVVPDAEGTGTVLLAGPDPRRLRPRFGPASAAAHAADGACAVGLDLPRLRRDVDTPGELALAVALGVGPRTAAALADEPQWARAAC